MIQKIVNFTGQNVPNIFKLTAGETGCCGDTQTICQFTASYAKAGALTALVIEENGVNKTLAVSPASTSAVHVAAALRTALFAAGYEDDEDVMWGGVKVTDMGTNHDVVITGNVKAVSLTHAGGSASFAMECKQVNLCNFTLSGYAGGSVSTPQTTMIINGLAVALIAVVPGTTTAGALQTAVNAALTAAGVLGSSTVTTVGSGGSQTYTISIAGSEGGNSMYLSTAYFSRSGCGATFV